MTLKKPKLLDMLANIGLNFEGRHHCGRDDAKNLARIVIRLMQDGAVFQFNERLNAGKLENITEDERALLNGFAEKPSNSLQHMTDNFEDLSVTSDNPGETSTDAR
ncbi:unnamed protein product [Clavelina lepadiformis]|uniref:Exonuclease domain-containing protein n=1 Tax=Clavelina lepadiformis TaxID=159417 RepID=A0ABP0H4D1_CLALP